MNLDNLHELIDRYEAKIDVIYGLEHDELFKWRAMKTWRQEWFRPADAFSSFADRFSAAKRDFSLFIDNSRMHPSTGVLKLWEKDADAVEYLFSEVLFADSKGDIGVVQDSMDSFLDGYEQLRQKHFPRNWSYKQDRHSASVYLAMNDPELNYVYKSSEATTMARYVDFGFTIGSGGSFSLEMYYMLCAEIVSALKQHESLLAKHFSKLTDACYDDQSLHLLAFDLMYCCRTYNYYDGLTAPLTGKTIKKSNESEAVVEYETEKETARKEEVRKIQKEIALLTLSCEAAEEISLLGVQVNSNQYGIGTVVKQAINRITVAFSDTEKSFILNRKYSLRPRFDNDDEIVSLFTEYDEAQGKIRMLEQQIEHLQV